MVNTSVVVVVKEDSDGERTNGGGEL